MPNKKDERESRGKKMSAKERERRGNLSFLLLIIAIFLGSTGATLNYIYPTLPMSIIGLLMFVLALIMTVFALKITLSEPSNKTKKAHK